MPRDDASSFRIRPGKSGSRKGRDEQLTLSFTQQVTRAGRYVDWEIQASLRAGQIVSPNGLLGVKLPTFTNWPERFNTNLLQGTQQLLRTLVNLGQLDP